MTTSPRPAGALLLAALLTAAWGCGSGLFPEQIGVGGGTAAVTLVRLVISPKVDSLAPWQTTQFSVTGTYNDSTHGVPAVTYTATGGTIVAGLYTAGATVGTYSVIAKQPVGTLADTAVVVVKGAALTAPGSGTAHP